MPQRRYQCSCGHERVELVLRASELAPDHCGVPMSPIMPRGVVGRCRPDSNGAHAGSGFSTSRRSEPPPAARAEPARTIDMPTGEQFELLGAEGTEHLPEQRWVATDLDPEDTTAIPEPRGGVYAKDYEDCHADERTERWKDTSEALTAWHTKQLEAKGETPTAARDLANETSQQTVARAREDSTRGDGLT